VGETDFLKKAERGFKKKLKEREGICCPGVFLIFKRGCGERTGKGSRKRFEKRNLTGGGVNFFI